MSPNTGETKPADNSIHQWWNTEASNGDAIQCYVGPALGKRSPKLKTCG